MNLKNFLAGLVQQTSVPYTRNTWTDLNTKAHFAKQSNSENISL